VHAESLAERYARLAQEAPGRRGTDLTLRILDLGLSTVLAVVLSPVWLVVAVSILLSSGRPVLYRGNRVGLGAREFTMLKFRTLRRDAEARLGPHYGDELTRRTREEVTRVGRWLRATQLDELAQLWNVLRGQMSLVGPRPIRPTFFEQLVAEIPEYWQRLVVRPGLTGLAQTRMGREESWAEKTDRRGALRAELRLVAST
jgi:lipopolysaccharide/colanic/teichoic acid biosynthesis glycosyltransferase